MPDIYFKSVPFSKEDVTLALESGVDGIITEAEHVEGVRSLALCDVRAEADMPSVLRRGFSNAACPSWWCFPKRWQASRTSYRS